MRKLLITAIAGLSLFGCHPVFAQNNPSPPSEGCITTEQVIEIGRDKLGQAPYLTVVMQSPVKGYLWLLVNKTNKTWTLLVSCDPTGASWKPAAQGDNYLDYRDKGI